jgi:hypothetical protein
MVLPRKRDGGGGGRGLRDDVTDEAALHGIRLDHNEGALALLHVERC